MNAKEYLEQVIVISQTIRSLIAEADTLRELSLASGAIRYDNDRVTGSAPQSAKFEGQIVKLVDLQDEIQKDINEQIALHKEIRDVIAQIEDESVRNIIRMRFLAMKRIEEIAGQMQMAQRTVIRKLEAGYHEVSLITGYPEPPRRNQTADRHADSRRILRAWKQETDQDS